MWILVFLATDMLFTLHGFPVSTLQKGFSNSSGNGEFAPSEGPEDAEPRG